MVLRRKLKAPKKRGDSMFYGYDSTCDGWNGERMFPAL